MSLIKEELFRGYQNAEGEIGLCMKNIKISSLSERYTAFPPV